MVTALGRPRTSPRGVAWPIIGTMRERPRELRGVRPPLREAEKLGPLGRRRRARDPELPGPGRGGASSQTGKDGPAGGAWPAAGHRRRPRQRPACSALHDAYGRPESRRADVLRRLHRGRLPRQVGQPPRCPAPHRLQGDALQRQARWRRGGFHGLVVCPRVPSGAGRGGPGRPSRRGARPRGGLGGTTRGARPERPGGHCRISGRGGASR